MGPDADVFGIVRWGAKDDCVGCRGANDDCVGCSNAKVDATGWEANEDDPVCDEEVDRCGWGGEGDAAAKAAESKVDAGTGRALNFEDPAVVARILD